MWEKFVNQEKNKHVSFTERPPNIYVKNTRPPYLPRPAKSPTAGK